MRYILHHEGAQWLVPKSHAMLMKAKGYDVEEEREEDDNQPNHSPIQP